MRRIRFLIAIALLAHAAPVRAQNSQWNFPPYSLLFKSAGTTVTPTPAYINFSTGITASLSAGTLTITTTGGVPVPQTRTITASSPITIDGSSQTVDLSANRTLACASCVTLTGNQVLTNKTLTSPVINGATSSGTTSIDFSGNSGAFKGTTGNATFGNANFVITGSSGAISTYNGTVTAGVGVPYILGVGQDVASTGGGAQSTSIASYSPTAGTAGTYRVGIVCSVTLDDAITAAVTWTDAVNTTAQSVNCISGVSPGANKSTQCQLIIRANASSAIAATITASTQATTKCSSLIEKLN